MGYPSKIKPAYANIHFFPLASFSRISFGRFLAPLKIALNIHKAKPDILIVNTHELLIVGSLNRIFFGTRIIYDIQENYFRNILYSEALPKLFRPVFALWVRAKEKITSPLFHWFFLAEKGYQNEFKFFQNRYTTIENKAILPTGQKRIFRSGYNHLLFSGTLAESTGVFVAIRLAIELHQLDHSIRLMIIGYCAKSEILSKIRSTIASHGFITLIGGDQLVPHQEIVNSIATSNFGIICYPHSPHTQNSIPTKLYEYLSYQLPIIIQDKQVWRELISPCQAGISINFENLNAKALLEEMKVRSFYTQPAENTTWDSEAKKLLEALKTI